MFLVDTIDSVAQTGLGPYKLIPAKGSYSHPWLVSM